MRRVLIVTYNFHPIVGANSIRIAKFVKYLREFGWCAVVLTTKCKSAPNQNGFDGDNLTNDINQDVPIIRIPDWLRDIKGARYLNQWLPEPGLLTFWTIVSVILGTWLTEKYNCKAIMTTSTPGACHLIGYGIKRFTGLPLILDYRDNWTNNPYSPSFATRLHKLWAVSLERHVVNQANGIVTVSSLRANQLASHLQVPKEKIVLIQNGFDPDDFKIKCNKVSSSDELCIRYIGAIYGGRINALIKFVRLACKLSEGISSYGYKGIRIELVGSIDNSVIRQLNANVGRGVSIIVRGIVGHMEAIRMMQTADLLLLLVGDYSDAPAKVYEYMASQTPIVIVGRFASDDIILQGIPYLIIENENEDHLEERIAGLVQIGRELRTNRSVKNHIRQFSRLAGARKLADLLNRRVCA